MCEELKLISKRTPNSDEYLETDKPASQPTLETLSDKLIKDCKGNTCGMCIACRPEIKIENKYLVLRPNLNNIPSTCLHKGAEYKVPTV